MPHKPTTTDFPHRTGKQAGKVPPPLCSLSRHPSLPTVERYEGVVARFCDFCGIGTGSIEGNFEAFRELTNRSMKACAAAHGTTAVNSGQVYGKGRLGFDE